MLQLENRTPFTAGLNLLPNEQGVDTLYLIVKASFNMGREWTLADEQTPLLEADEFYGDPQTTSMKYASDFHLGKPGTDVIMNGLASAPQGQSVRELDVSLQVGGLKKTVRVFGDRQWINGAISRPEPFSSMPLVYEKAFGGVSLIDGELESADPRNPIGCGYLGARDPQAMEGMPLPNLEDPAALIRDPRDMPTPACFALVCPGWSPRVDYCGTYDDDWCNNRAPFMPLDFDKRFFQMAHPDLVSPQYLRGGEEIVIEGMHPRGRIVCRVPEIHLNADIKIDGELVSPEFGLETILIEPNRLRLEMTWRTAYECDKKSLKVESARITMRR